MLRIVKGREINEPADFTRGRIKRIMKNRVKMTATAITPHLTAGK